MYKQLVKLAVVLALAGIAQHFANIAAYAERGHYAMGGEILVFPFVLIVGSFITGLLDWRLELPVDNDNEMEDDFYDTDN
ncbi:MAG: hypothetical protein LIO54_09500 [Oscillospiraceae bacterium]|nr:hypothetical protein [Oscillospiraceae bacterium]